jgi:uncharacterized protein (TIGR03437 family)
VAVTPSAPQPCMLNKGYEVENIFITHLDSQGALLDRSYFYSGLPLQPPPVWLGLAGARSVRLAASFNVYGALAELQFGEPGAPAAPCVSDMVLNAATFFAFVPGGVVNGPASVSPGEFVSLTGFGMGPEQGATYQPNPDGSVPRQLAGVQVFFDDVAAPLLYVQSQQINAIAPFELAGQTTTNMRVMYNNATIGSARLQVNTANPGIFRVHLGLSDQALAINQDGTMNGPFNPAPRGSIISLYGTGFGTASLPGVTGAVSPLEASEFQAAVSVGITEPGFDSGIVAQVKYAGIAPGQLEGIGQINVRLLGAIGQPLPYAGIAYVIVGSSTSSIYVK